MVVLYNTQWEYLNRTQTQFDQMYITQPYIATSTKRLITHNSNLKSIEWNLSSWLLLHLLVSGIHIISRGVYLVGRKKTDLRKTLVNPQQTVVVRLITKDKISH